MKCRRLSNQPQPSENLTLILRFRFTKRSQNRIILSYAFQGRSDWTIWSKWSGIAGNLFGFHLTKQHAEVWLFPSHGKKQYRTTPGRRKVLKPYSMHITISLLVKRYSWGLKMGAYMLPIPRSCNQKVRRLGHDAMHVRRVRKKWVCRILKTMLKTITRQVENLNIYRQVNYAKL